MTKARKTGVSPDESVEGPDEQEGTDRYHVVCHGCAYEDVVDTELEAVSALRWHRTYSGHNVRYAPVMAP